ncbi:NPCBM/NEW2 domain-containing protein [Streptomyces sp. NPDC046237]|uniref:NPCBM/NEW2 domain-containing protein n=1 Tax=Streptomyces sp. NPDC046237 TaxID=3154914 RepID=UPI0033DEAAA1
MGPGRAGRLQRQERRGRRPPDRLRRYEAKYAKGLGVHAPSDIAFHLGAAGNRFTALVWASTTSRRNGARSARPAPRCTATTGCC